MSSKDVAVKEEPVVDKAIEEEIKVDLDDPDLFLNRELSLLDFQRRVLEEGLDENNPPLERAKFLAFVGNNLDEFYMVRVAGLKKQVAAGVGDISADGMTPAEQLAAIRKVSLSLMAEAQESFQDDLVPLLDKQGVHILNYEQLTEKQKEIADRLFFRSCFPCADSHGF